MKIRVTDQSLYSACDKFLEKLIYNRISPIIEENLPIKQAGFRPNRNCCDQVLALTSYIESGFQNGVVFVDLTAAYDTVWKDGLIHKLYNVIRVPCGKMVSLLEDMLSNRQFRVFVEDKSSKFRFLNNGLPQGSVLSPILFNLYTSDLPPTNSRKFIYADNRQWLTNIRILKM
jgi:retron-type reverse transcriptase